MNNEGIEVDHLHQNVGHRAILRKVKDDGDQQLVDYGGLEGEEHTEVVRVQGFGLSTNPPPESEGVVFGLGTRDMPMVHGLESPKHRPRDLPSGATKLYDSSNGFVYLDAGGNLHAKVDKGATIEAGQAVTIKAPSLTIDCPNVTINGDIAHNGSMTTSGIHTDSLGDHA